MLKLKFFSVFVAVNDIEYISDDTIHDSQDMETLKSDDISVVVLQESGILFFSFPGPEVLPIFTYEHSWGNTIVGGHVYRGCMNPALNGKYIYGDFVSGWVHSCC